MSYEEAEQKRVNLELVLDRYKKLGNWFEARGEIDRAIEILNKYRNLAPSRFDL